MDCDFIEFGDCREIMRGWKMEGIRAQMCVTSPPYFGLRDYGHPGQIGLEQTPEEYIAAMVEVFRCVRDVLADDGTLWLNIGDSWASTAQGTMNAPQKSAGKNADVYANFRPKVGLPPKNLLGIPWRLALALQKDGWWLRQDIIWAKPNPAPERVKDRCTKSHEYIFLLSKSQNYFYDSDAVRENSSGGLGHNKRDVWVVPTSRYKGAHFATFPPALIEPCILAGSRPGDIVLDPFMGSGTTAAVARKHKRKYIGCELNETYGELQDERIRAAT